MKKFFWTLEELFTQFMARTFGRYSHSGWDHHRNYCVYDWNGKRYFIFLNRQTYREDFKEIT